MMSRFRHRRPLSAFVVTIVLLAAWTSAVHAEMPTVFGDNMVLQRDMPVPVWGRAGAGADVSVGIGEHEAETNADASGKWMLRLPPMKAGGPHEMTVKIKGQKPLTFKNILVGEVWVCSGQSNMQWPVSHSDNAEQEIAAATHPSIRLFSAAWRTAPQPKFNLESTPWQPCSPDTIKNFSAVGYYFGRELAKQLDVPIGLINTSWGGTLIEPWTPPVGFALVPDLTEFVEKIEKADRAYLEAYDKYLDERAAYLSAARNAPADGTNQPAPPAPPQHPWETGNRAPTVIYNAMVAPLAPYAIAGAIWYQGESNCSQGDGLLYHEKMKALVGGWRSVWNQGQFPFYYVQIAPWKYAERHHPMPDRLPLIWQAQLMSLSIPNTGMAVVHDVGNIDDIHPKNKQEVGRRLSLWALAKTYGREGLVYSGPLYESMSVDGNKIRIRFDHVGSGLAARDGKPLSHFQIAGEDRKFVDAEAKIVGDEVVVSSEKVAEPLAVRFAWHELAEPNLMNNEGLPASPFRTDDW